MGLATRGKSGCLQSSRTITHTQKKKEKKNPTLKVFSYPLSLTLSGFYLTHGNVNFRLQYLFRTILQMQKHRQSYRTRLAFCCCFNHWHLLQRTDFSRHYPLVFSQVIHLQQSACLTSGQAHFRLGQAGRNGKGTESAGYQQHTVLLPYRIKSFWGKVCQNRLRWGL